MDICIRTNVDYLFVLWQCKLFFLFAYEYHSSTYELNHFPFMNLSTHKLEIS